LLDLARFYNSTCQYCLKRFSVADLTIDHIIPKSKNGSDEHDNRTLACLGCNQKKASHSPYFKIKNESVKAPSIPSIFLHVSSIRKEWEKFL
jgi:CRISPR/Cas system Type II protein with McrA/HNH and RuvC-like nuclease domain